MARPQHGGMRDMTVGSPAKQILLFTLPLLAGNFLQQLYNMVDSWVVGNYVSDAALAAVGTGFPVIFFFSSLFMGLSTGGTVVISQFYGAGQMDRVHDAVDTIYAAFLRLILPMTALAMLAAKPLLHVLQVDETAMDEALTYLLVVCGGLIGTVGYNFNAGILNGLGNSRTTLLFLSIAAGLNIVLDLVLVLVIPLGVLGVALGTVISQAFSWLFGLFYINRHFPELRIRLFRGKLDKVLFREIVRIGLPAGLQMSMVSLGTMAILSKVNSFGKAFTAGMNVGNKLDSLAFLPTQSLAAGITAFVGQNMGAGREDRAHQGIRATVLAADVWTVFTALILCLFSESFIGRPGHRGGVLLPPLRHAALRPLRHPLRHQRRHAGRGGQRLPHAECGRLPDPHPGPGGLPAGGPLRPPRDVLGLRHRLGAGLRPLRLVLCHRPLEAPLPPPGEAGPGIPA